MYSFFQVTPVALNCSSFSQLQNLKQQLRLRSTASSSWLLQATRMTFWSTTLRLRYTRYRLQGNNFPLHQTLDTFEASDIKPFTINRDNFLAVANNDNGSTYLLSTVVYRLEGGKFHEFQRIPTNSAWSVPYFTVSPRKFLVVTNSKSGIVSIYKWLKQAYRTLR